MRYFHQSPDYWLDHATLQDWRRIYSRELAETPPADAMVAAYLGYTPPGEASAAPDGEGDGEEWECPFPERTE